MKRILAAFLCLAIAFLIAAGCILPTDHFEVRFSGDMASTRKFAIGKTTGSLIFDPGYFANGTTTGFYHAPSDDYNLYDQRDFEVDWNFCETYTFEAQKRYEVVGTGMNAYFILVLP